MAETITKSLRIPKETIEEIEQTFRGRDFSSVANELLAEAVKTRRCPGIVFADGPTGRRARISGTGIDVWEVIAAYRSLGRRLEKLEETFHWLDERQLRAALAYYQCYPEEIEGRIEANESWNPERIAQRYPFTRLSIDEVLPGRRPKSKNRRDSAKRRNRRR